MLKLYALIGISSMFPIAAADNSQTNLFFEFLDEEAIYKIRILNIRNLIHDKTEKSTSYQMLTGSTYEAQLNGIKPIKVPITLAATTQWLRISIQRKERDNFKGGGWFFVDLRNEGLILRENPWLYFTISAKKQFTELSKGNSKGIETTFTVNHERYKTPALDLTKLLNYSDEPIGTDAD